MRKCISTGFCTSWPSLQEKSRDRRDMENLIDTARRYGEIADQMFGPLEYPRPLSGIRRQGRPCLLKALELCELERLLCGLRG